MEQEIQKLKEDVKRLTDIVDSLQSETSIPYNVGEAFRERLNLRSIINLPAGFSSLPLASVSSPSGGATVDSQARTAIVDLTTRLEDAGIIEAN